MRFLKRCCTCKKYMKRKFFGKNFSLKDGLSKQCLSCKRKTSLKYYYKNRDKINKKMRGYNIRIYWRHLTRKQALIEYNKLLKKQNKKCAICESKKGSKNLAVDHCHKTGKIRGLLCNKCNRGLGYLGDSIKIIKRALKYLLKK